MVVSVISVMSEGLHHLQVIFYLVHFGFARRIFCVIRK